MKRKMLYLFCAASMLAYSAGAQNSARRGQDTSKAMKRNAQPDVAPEPPLPPMRPDTARYRNPVFNNGIKSAEYQNRGAEDRRDPNSADPNAIPNKRVPEKEVLPPDPVK